MSSWKKASKINQKTHRERHQPEFRKHLGLLEKKKDYIKRATDYNEKQAALKLLRKRALNKNPDEFYHHMINSKTENGIHHENDMEDEHTPEQIRLMHTQDLKYITMKRTAEMKKVNRLQAELHLVDVANKLQNKHVYFVESKKGLKEIDASKKRKDSLNLELLSKYPMPDLGNDVLKQLTKSKESTYKDLAKRIAREKELSVIQQKLEIKRHLQNKKTLLRPKKIKKGSKNAPPVYEWKYERQR